MRLLMKARLSSERADELARQGRLGSTIEAIVQATQPQAVYFGLENGKRTAFLVLDVPENADMPWLAEPWFLALGAEIETTPVMTPDELRSAMPRIYEAIKQFS